MSFPRPSFFYSTCVLPSFARENREITDDLSERCPVKRMSRARACVQLNSAFRPRAAPDRDDDARLVPARNFSSLRTCLTRAHYYIYIYTCINTRCRGLREDRSRERRRAERALTWNFFNLNLFLIYLLRWPRRLWLCFFILIRVNYRMF